uniref:solute carrier family 15 member 2-like n=1 Tax=Myxine glutinosa TaxID=7769 RepID=UPI00358FF3B4
MTTPEEPAAKKKPIDFSLCLLCQGKKYIKRKVLEPLSTPQADTYETFLRNLTKRDTYRNPTYVAINQRLQGLSAGDLMSRKALWHRSYYGMLTHIQHIERDKGRYEQATSQMDTRVLTGAQRKTIPNDGLPTKTVSRICGSNYPMSIAFVVVTEFCERFSFYGMKAVLVLYFCYFLHWNPDTSTVVYHAVDSLAYFTPILGALVADSWLGKFRTILYLSIVYVIGHVVNTIGAVPVIGDANTHTALAIVGLVLITLGIGGTKPCAAAFGGDQFEAHQIYEQSKFFSIFYLAINMGSLLSTFITPMLRDYQCFGGDCYVMAFSVPAGLMIIALIIFRAGSPLYTKIHPKRNVLMDVSRCIGFAIKNRWKHRNDGDLPRNHWLDWAKEKHNDNLINDVKKVLRVLLLYLPLPMFWALFDQQGSRWTLQATAMSGDFGTFVLKPDQMQTLNPLLIVVFIPIFDLGLYPLIKKCGINFTPLRRMATGMFLAVIAFILASLVQRSIDNTLPDFLVGNEMRLRFLNLNKEPVFITAPNQSTLLSGIEVSNYGTHQSQDGKVFTMKLNETANCSATAYHEKSFTLLITENLTCNQITDLNKKPKGSKAHVRIVNALPDVVTVKIGDMQLENIPSGGYKVYQPVEHGIYDINVTSQGETKIVSTQSLDFGGAYTIVTHKVGILVDAKLFIDLPPNTVHITWQIPQYFVMTAGEMMFSMTGLEFSYTQVLFGFLQLFMDQ